MSNATPTSGNIFADLGLAEAEELSVKAQLILSLERLMRTHKLTQKDVASRVGSDQPTISKVLRGNLDLVTTDRLLLWLKKLDQEIVISVKDGFADSAADGSVLVISD